MSMSRKDVPFWGLMAVVFAAVVYLLAHMGAPVAPAVPDPAPAVPPLPRLGARDLVLVIVGGIFAVGASVAYGLATYRARQVVVVRGVPEARYRAERNARILAQRALDRARADYAAVEFDARMDAQMHAQRIEELTRERDEWHAAGMGALDNIQRLTREAEALRAQIVAATPAAVPSWREAVAVLARQRTVGVRAARDTLRGAGVRIPEADSAAFSAAIRALPSPAPKQRDGVRVLSVRPSVKSHGRTDDNPRITHITHTYPTVGEGGDSA